MALFFFYLAHDTTTASSGGERGNSGMHKCLYCAFMGIE